jgi:hypothetical protein
MVPLVDHVAKERFRSAHDFVRHTFETFEENNGEKDDVTFDEYLDFHQHLHALVADGFFGCKIRDLRKTKLWGRASNPCQFHKPTTPSAESDFRADRFSIPTLPQVDPESRAIESVQRGPPLESRTLPVGRIAPFQKERVSCPRCEFIPVSFESLPSVWCCPMVCRSA